MSRARRRSKDEAQARLLSLWERREEHGEPIGCVATTYTFEGPFFEEHCLGRFVGMDTSPDESGAAYLIEREERLSQIVACVLVDRACVTAKRSLRWHQVPIRVPGGGIQHSKVTLLAWERLIRVLVSSANLTEPGYRRNHEQVGVLDFTPEAGPPRQLLAEVAGFLRMVTSFQPRGADGEGPGQALETLLRHVESVAAAWPDRSWPRGEPKALFMPVLPGGRSLLERLRTDAWPGAGPQSVRVMSPFFDDGDRAPRVLAHLVEQMAAQGERTINFLTSGHELPDGTVELPMPETYRRPGSRCEHGFWSVPAMTESGDARSLHAKMLSFWRERRAAHCIGSSNFTAAGLGLADGGPVNVEANLVYLPREADDGFDKACEAGVPECDEIPVERIRFVAPTRQTPEATALVPLPAQFGPALYRPGVPEGTILLHVDPTTSFAWSAATEDDRQSVLDSDHWTELGRPAKLEGPAPGCPPSALVLTWVADDGTRHDSLWIVNVTDASLLPSADELRHLPLETLLDVLTSALPLHEALRRALRARSLEAGAPQPAVAVDPHARVDTSSFLLRRVKRVSDALECLRERLERPVHHLDALRWRLHGPVGPVTLAERLAEAEQDGAAFMITEVALTLRHVDWSQARRALGTREVDAEVARVEARLKELAVSRPAPTNLARYVAAHLAPDVTASAAPAPPTLAPAGLLRPKRTDAASGTGGEQGAGA